MTDPSKMTHEQRLSAGWKVKESPPVEEMTHQQRLDAGWKVSKPKIPKKQMTPQEKWEANERKWDDFGRGARVSGKKLLLGLKDIGDNWLGMDSLSVSDEDRAALAQERLDANRTDSGWSKGGESSADIASFLVPGTMAAKGAMGLNVASKLPFLAPLAAETLTGGAVAGARLPEGKETRTKNALLEMGGNVAGGMAGRFAGQALGKMKEGITISKAGKELQALDSKGVYTPGQLGENPLWEGLEKVSDLFPGAASAVRQAKDRGHDSLNKLALRSAAPNPKGITLGGDEGTEQVLNQTNAGYKDAWNKVGGVKVSTLDDIIAKAEKFAGFTGDAEAGPLRRIIASAEKVKEKGPRSAKRLRNLDKTMATTLETALNKGDVGLYQDIKTLRKRLRQGIPKENAKQLIKMDKLYPKWLAVQKASYDASNVEGRFNPLQLNAAAKSIPTGKTKGAIGKGPLQPLSKIGLKTTGKKEALPPLSIWKRFAPLVESPVPGPLMDAAARPLLGQTDLQKRATSPLIPKDMESLLKLLELGSKAAGQERAQDF